MRTLLLIEDSPTQAIHFKLHFEKLGYEVKVFHNGKHGLNYLKKLKAENLPSPNLIVLDYHLPDENGVVVCQQLKSDTEFRSIPVLIYSAENKLRNMTISYQAGADYYVVKGPEGEQVLELLVDTILTRRQRWLTRKNSELADRRLGN